MALKLRNVAIIAHVDHGKTTLVDKLLRQSGTLSDRGNYGERILDANDLERERGITILAKNTAITWNGYRINIVDTPGHADFGGEVERVLSMVDSVLLLVDAVDGPMPQTRFVTQKAFALGLQPIVVINKIDRPGARPDEVLDETFELFDKLGASDEQLDFRCVYASALEGYAGLEIDQLAEDMSPLLDLLIEAVPPPDVDPEGPFQMQISALDYSSYTGVVGIGRIERGRVKPRQAVAVVGADGIVRPARIQELEASMGLQRLPMKNAQAGEIVAVSGLGGLNISDTLCAPDTIEALPPLNVDEPTVRVSFEVNTSPLAGRSGKFVTSRQIAERLERELLHNVALRVEATDTSDRWTVCGRGELHLAVLIETMRREGFELAVGRPTVIMKTIDGVKHEPFETVVLECDDEFQGPVMEALGERRGELSDLVNDGKGRVRVTYGVPTRGLLGFQTDYRTMTRGTGLIHRIFDGYRPASKVGRADRRRGVLVSMADGTAVAYGLFNLQARGRLLIAAGAPVYEGLVVGIHQRDNDLAVNPMKAKQLTNVRSSGTDEAVVLTPPLVFSLEETLEFIADDELVEVTPDALRVRKRLLKEYERRGAARQK
jgi:GTP-binding protein